MSMKWLWACAILSMAAIVVPVGAAQPVLHYSFDTLASVIPDESGSGNDGTVNGGVELSADAYAGAAASFNGVDTYIETTRPIQDDFTICAWIKTGVSGSTGSYAYQGSGLVWSDVAGTANDFVMAVLGTKLSFFGGNPDTSVTGESDVVTGEWVFVTAVRNIAAQTLAIYVNGRLDGSATYTNTGSLNANSALMVGANTLDSHYYKGLMDEVKLFGQVLTDTEILFEMYGVPLSGNPNPADGATGVTSTELQWTAGFGVAFHNVYFGTSAELTDADLVSERQTGTTCACPIALEAGATYYWRVDEIEADGTTVYTGNVWSFTALPLTAWDPSPADGSVRILLDQGLSWTGGEGAIFYTVYIGDSYDEVDNATSYTAQIVDATFDPGALEAGKTYYWRVDQFVGIATYKGPVWSFSTVPDVSITDSHLVGYWTFDEGEGTVAVDWSGYGNHGTLNGSPTWVDGQYGSALQFDTAKYVDCGEAGTEVTDDFTLAAWVQLSPGNSGTYGGIGGKLHVSTYYWGFGLVRHSTNVFRLWVGDGTSDLTKSAVSSNVTYVDTEWHHVAGVREGTTNSLYIDGVKQNASSSTSFVATDQSFHIGRQYSASDQRYFPGVIDDVRLYDTAATETEIAEIMLGNVNVAREPSPTDGASVDIRNISEITWSAGNSEVSHDVYFGTDRQAVADADHDAAEFKGNQANASFSVSDLVTFGGGAYYWRIDEVAADGTVYAGYVWNFTVPDYLIVDDFESYNDVEETETTIYQAWTDGYSDHLSTSTVGNTDAPFAEQKIVNSGRQAMPFDYDNTVSPYFAEAYLAWTTAQDWTEQGGDALSLAVRGTLGNGEGTLYVALQDSTGTLVVVKNSDAALVATPLWTTWTIPLSEFGVKVTAIKKLYIGVGDRDNPTAGGAGRIYIDDIRVVQQ